MLPYYMKTSHRLKGDWMNEPNRTMPKSQQVLLAVILFILTTIYTSNVKNEVG